MQVVWPPQAPTEKLDANEGSLVLRVNCPAGGILIPGDIGGIAQEHVCQELAAQAVSAVLVLPHHGGVTPLLQSFIAAVNPALLVQSNSYRRESPTLLQAIGGRKRLATFREGWICVELTDQGPKVTCMRPERMSD